jgi:hypothetical protein
MIHRVLLFVLCCGPLLLLPAGCQKREKVEEGPRLLGPPDTRLSPARPAGGAAPKPTQPERGG